MNQIIANMIIQSGHSWWQAEYYGGKIVSEWDTLKRKIHLPFGSAGTSDWVNLDKKNMKDLRIFCPNGECGGVKVPDGIKPDGYLFFQIRSITLKIGHGRSEGAHIIGVVENENGDCLCRAWEGAEWSQFETITDVKRLALAKKQYRVEVLGPGFCPTDFRYRCHSLVRPARLIEFRDNVRHFKYQNIGEIKLDVQGLRI
jgi:hypothetical protein